jgi:23S rRNA (pseudouridine1915-N3)-methyltransferase
MKISILALGRTETPYIDTGIKDYHSRIRKYFDTEFQEIPAPKYKSSDPTEERQKQESALIKRHIRAGDYFVLLDEKGKEFSSREFSGFISRRFLSGGKHLTFVIGGAYGFHQQFRREAGFILSLSRMTFPHQLVRLIFFEQLYRAVTLLKNQPYHHE